MVQQQVAQKDWQEREARVGTYNQDYAKVKNNLERLQTGIQNLRKERDVIRAECRALLRKASVYTQLGVSERCYASSIAAEIKILVAQKEFIQIVPGIQPDIRDLAVTRINLLSDALGVIQTAINSQVYESVSELEEVKQAVYKNYRLPKWVMDTRVEADQLYTHVSSIIVRIGTIANEQYENTELTNTLLQTLTCYTNVESLLKESTTSNKFESAQESLKKAVAALQTCGTETTVALQKIEQDKLVQADTAEALKSAAPVLDAGPVYRRAINELNINGLTEENYVEATYNPSLKIYEYKGYQTSGPTPEECDTTGLSRKLLSRIDPTNCRISDDSKLNYYEELQKRYYETNK